MARRWISESTAIKLLVEPQGAILALRLHTFSYLFFVTRTFLGVKKIRTADFVVARANYSAPGTLQLIARLYPDGL